jgi:3-methyladenine DNA glycosylase AlkD
MWQAKMAMWCEKKTQSMWEVFFVVATQFATKKQLKDLTHMFCF